MTTRHRKRIVREAGLVRRSKESAMARLRSGLERLAEAGRVLSAANEDKLRTAQSAIEAVLASLGSDDAPADEAAAADANCTTCDGEGKIKAGTTKCPDCGGSGKAADVKKEAKVARLVGLAEAYSGSADDAGNGAYLLSSLLNLMSDESDEPDQLGVLHGAFVALMTWIQMEVTEIGGPDDDTEDPFYSMWGWEAARKRLADSGGPVRLRAADAPPAEAAPDTGGAGGYVPEPYTADADETVQCPMCGCMNSPDARFCDQCGVALTGFHPSIGEAQRLKTDLIAISESAVKEDGTGAIKIIAPGWGSSGYYAPEVLERDGPSVFPAGTKMFWDHPTLTEEWERPERSLRDLAGETTSDARWMANGAAGPGLYADTKVFAGFAQAVNELAPSIGVSIRAYGTASVGEAEGQTGQIIGELVGAESIDFVTFPGAGGQVLSLFEAARQQRLVNPKPEEANMQVETDPKFIEVKQRAERAEEREVLREAKDVVATKLAEAEIPEITKARLKASLGLNPPVKAGKLDQPALEQRIEEAINSEKEYLAGLTSAGKIKGMGAGGPGAEPDLTPELEKAFQNIGMTEAGAKLAAAGRQ